MASNQENEIRSAMIVGEDSSSSAGSLKIGNHCNPEYDARITKTKVYYWQPTHAVRVNGQIYKNQPEVRFGLQKVPA